MIDPTKLELEAVTSTHYTVKGKGINIGCVSERDGKWYAISRFYKNSINECLTESEGVDCLKQHFCEWYNSVTNE